MLPGIHPGTTDIIHPTGGHGALITGIIIMATSRTGIITITAITAHGIPIGIRTGTIIIITNTAHIPIQFTSIVRAECIETHTQGQIHGSRVQPITVNDILFNAMNQKAELSLIMDLTARDHGLLLTNLPNEGE
jgi:hypothetical protein